MYVCIYVCVCMYVYLIIILYVYVCDLYAYMYVHRFEKMKKQFLQKCHYFKGQYTSGVTLLSPLSSLFFSSLSISLSPLSPCFLSPLYTLSLFLLSFYLPLSLSSSLLSLSSSLLPLSPLTSLPFSFSFPTSAQDFSRLNLVLRKLESASLPAAAEADAESKQVSSHCYRYCY